MENLIYILVPIAYFLYQGYQNYLKEQEKAKKRNFGVPPQQEITSEEEVKTEPMITKGTEAVELKPDYKLTKQEERVKQRREELVYEKINPTFSQDYYNPEIVTERRNAYKNRERDKKQLQPLNMSYDEEEDFDLRDAIIKEAILNRPYKDGLKKHLYSFS